MKETTPYFENFTPKMIEQYNKAVQKFYHELYEINVTDGTYKILYHIQNNYLTLIENGMIDEGIKDVTKNLLHPDDKERFLKFVSLKYVRENLSTGKPFISTEVRKLWYDGKYHWVSLLICPGEEENHKETYICFVTDIDERMKTQIQYIQEKQYQDVIVSDAILCAEFDLTNNIVKEIAPRILNSLSLPKNASFTDVIEAVAKELVYPSDREMFLKNLSINYLALASNENNYILSFEYRSFNAVSNDYFWASSFSNLIYDCNTGHLCCRWYVKDIDSRKRYELGLRERAERDQLTGVYNRVTFETLLENELENMKNEIALVVLDIDDFKWINDSFGHVYGDNVLKKITALLKVIIGNFGTIGRLGGDEFAIFIPGFTTREEVLKKVDQICKSMIDTVDFGKAEFSLSCSLGVAFAPNDGKTFTEIYRAGDEAQYQAKKNGKNQWKIYDKHMITELKKKKNHRIEGIYKGTDDFNSLLPNILFENGLTIDTLNILLDCVARHYEIDNIAIVNLKKFKIIAQWSAKKKLIECIDPSTFRDMNREKSIRIVEKGENWICNDVSLLPEDVRVFYINKGIQAELAMPIYCEGKINAAVIFSLTRAKHIWTYEEIEAAKRVANLTSSILENIALKDSSATAAQLKKTLAELRISEERFRIALDKTNIYIWEFDLNKHEFVNAQKMSDYYNVGLTVKNAPYSLIKEKVIHPDNAKDYLDVHQKLYNGEKTATCLAKIRNSQGAYIWYRITYTNIFDQFGHPIKAIGVSEDINIQKQLQMRYEEEAKYHRVLLDDLIVFYKYNLTQNCICEDTLEIGDKKEKGWKTYQDVFQNAIQHVVNEEEKRKFIELYDYKNLLKAFKAGKRSINFEYRRSDDIGRIKWVSTKINMIKHSSSDEVYAFISVKDIDYKKKQELSLKERAEKDDLTGLYNRRTFETFFESVVQKKQNKDSCSAFALIDFSNLKTFTDLYGHLYTKCIIREISEVMSMSFPATSIMARISGDEFVIFCDEIQFKELFINKVKDFCNTFTNDFYVKDIKIQLSLAMGIVFSKIQDITYESIIKEAELAVGSAKMIGEHHFFVHDNTVFNQYEKEAYFTKNVGIAFVKDSQDSLNYSLSHQKSVEITNKRLEEQKLFIPHDKLTGLLNRNDYLKCLQKIDEESLSSLGVVSADINGLKQLNQKYGHEAGDKMILFIADIFKNHFSDAHIYRLTGDEFLVLYEDITYEAFIESVTKVKQEINANYPESIAIGYTWSDKDIHIEKLVAHADEFMLLAKHKYYQIATSLNKRYIREVADVLHNELERGMYVMYLQPKADTHTGLIVGAEALIRKINENGKIIFPDQFVPMLEEHNLIRYIDLFIFEEVCKILSKWKKNGQRIIPISVNFSRETIFEENIIDSMMKIMQKYSVTPDWIEIEITESIGEMEPEIVAAIGEKINEKGFKLSIDDFGARYSNISILTKMNFDILKLDKTMINDLVINERTKIIVKNFLDTCRILKIKSVAEGVETKGQLEVLKELKCDLIQGYFINKPIPVADFEKIYL